MVNYLITRDDDILTDVSAIKAKTDNLPAAPADLATTQAAEAAALTAADEAEQIETHFHNREYWFGIAATPTATHFADRARLTPFVATSGSGDFGTDPGDTANVIGSGDLPVRLGDTMFDFRRLSIVDVSNANPFILRIVHGTTTESAAEAAGQYTEIVVQQQTAAGQNKPQDVWCERITAGEFIWVRCKSATNNATISFLVGIHEYPAPVQP